MLMATFFIKALYKQSFVVLLLFCKILLGTSEENIMKKALKVVSTIFTAIVCVFTVIVMIFTIISVTTFDRNNRSLFGFKMFIVLSDSMSATHFDAGDVVLVKEADFSDFKVGDIVCFSSTDTSNYGETVTHMIREITTNDKGEAAFVTYGTTTGVDDATLVTAPYVKGIYVGRIPYAGRIFTYLKTTPGYICCILIPFLILILIQAVNSIKLFRQYKQEQAAILAEEKAKLEAERAESQKMLDELQALKAQLAAMKDTDEGTQE